MSRIHKSENTDSAKTKRQLVDELKSLRRQISQLQRTVTWKDRMPAAGVLDSSRETLKRNLRLANNVLDSTVDAVISIDENRKITHFSKGAQKLFGYEAAEINGKPLQMLLPPQSRRKHSYLVTPRIPSDDDGRMMDERDDIVWLKKDGTTFPAKSAISSHHREETSVSTVYLRDLSPLRDAQELTTKYRDELTHMGRLGLLTEISASLAHELTQPIAAILTNSQVLMHTVDTGSATVKEQIDTVSDLINDAQRAGEVIHRVRRMSQAVEIRQEVFAINEIILDTEHLLHSLMIMNQTRLILELASDLPDLRGDRIQIQQVLLNLLTNALDAMKVAQTTNRQLIVRSSYIEPTDVEVRVIDNGIGLEKLSFKKMLQPFYTTKENGIGMGLAISNTILKNHGGRIWAEANQGQGTTICVSLPVTNGVTETREDSYTPSNRATPNRPTIFVVDDDPSICGALKRLLGLAGYAVETFTSAQGFLQREHYAGTGCVVADLHMPGGSGFELQARLKERDYAMPVIFITGADDTASGVRAMKEGALDFLTKPIDNDELIQVVAHALEIDRQTQDRHRRYLIARKKVERLTAREKEIMRLVVRGLRNKQIASSLEISEKTVKAHRGRVMQKTELRTVADLVLLSESVASAN